MSKLKERSAELRNEIEVFFDKKKTQIQLEIFVPKMRAKLRSLNPINDVNLSPITLEQYRLLKTQADQMMEFSDLAVFLDQKIEDFENK